MNTTSDNIDNDQNIISQERAEKLADDFLKERYYNYEKVIFKSCEKVQNEDQSVYRFSGLLIEKTRAFIDKFARDKRGVTYKFVIEVNSNSGRVLNHYLT